MGGSLDEIEARNQAEIASRLGHPVAPGAVSIDDVVAMTRAGVPEEVIVTHVQTHGVIAPLQATDLILLQQQGVSPRVVQSMQNPPQVAAPAAYGQPVVVAQPYPAPVPVYYAPPPYFYPPYPRRGAGWAVGVGGN